MKTTRLSIDKNITKILIEVINSQDIAKKTKEEIAKLVCDFIRPRYTVNNNDKIKLDTLTN